MRNPNHTATGPRHPSANRRCGDDASIVVHGHIAFCSDELQPYLSDFSAPEHPIVQDPSGEIAVGKRAVPLFRSNPRSGVITFPAAAVPYVVQLLHKNDVEAQVHGACHVHSLPEPQRSGRDAVDGVAKHILDETRGIVRARTSTFFPKLVHELAGAFPGERIAVLESSGSKANAIANEIRRYRPVGVVENASGGFCGEHVIVGTSYGLARDDVRLHEVPLVLMTDPAVVWHQNTQRLLSMPELRFRMYGFVSDENRLAPSELVRLCAWFGIHTVRIHSLDSVARHVCVGWLPGWRPKKREKRQHLHIRNLVCDYIRGHSQRHRYIMGLAAKLRSLAEQEFVSLPARCSFTSGQPLPSARIVLTEDPTHAIEISKKLPDWRVSPAPMADWRAECLARGSPNSRLLEDGEVADQMILTFDTCTPERLAAASTVLRIDGGMGIPNCLADIVMHNKNFGRLLILDIYDRHHPQLRPRASSRADAYREIGWPQSNISEEWIR